MMIYVPLLPSPVETKKKKKHSRLVSGPGISVRTESLVELRCSLPAGRINQGARTKKYGLWFMYVDSSPCSMYPM